MCMMNSILLDDYSISALFAVMHNTTCIDVITIFSQGIFSHTEKHFVFGGRILYLPEMKLIRYRPSGPCRVSKGLPKALYMKKAVPTMVKTTRIMEKRIILTWMLTGMAWTKSGKTEDKPRFRGILWSVVCKCDLKCKLSSLTCFQISILMKTFFLSLTSLQGVCPKI